MNNWGIEPDDWFKRIFGSSNFPSSRGGTGSGDWFRDMPRQFEQMRREMERIFQEQFTGLKLSTCKITETASMTNTPPTTTSRSSCLQQIATTPSMPPMASDPVSPMKTFAG